jgi:hypothetical protein
MKSFEVKEVKEVIATLEVLGRAKRQSRAIDDTLAGDTSGRTFVVNFANFDNFANSTFSYSRIPVFPKI